MRIILILLMTMVPAMAQQQPSVTELRGALAASMAQTDAVRNLHIQAEAKALVLGEENTRLKAELEELRKPKPKTGN